jgi:hypothetical protein
MAYVEITSNAHALAHALGDVHGEQIPFATALALTEVAFNVQRQEKSEMARALELRNRFSQGGVQVSRAEKSDWPVTYAEVGIEQRRSYLIDHIAGGKRQGGSHGRAILEQADLRSGSGKVPAGKRPRAMIERAMRAKRQAELNKAFGGKGKSKPAPFLLYSQQWGGELIMQRTGPGRDDIKTVYAFRKGVAIKREFEMDEIAQRVVGLTYHQAFNKAMRRAIKSGR